MTWSGDRDTRNDHRSRLVRAVAKADNIMGKGNSDTHKHAHTHTHSRTQVQHNRLNA